MFVMLLELCCCYLNVSTLVKFSESMCLGLQEKLEACEPLEIDSYFSSTQDRLEKK